MRATKLASRRRVDNPIFTTLGLNRKILVNNMQECQPKLDINMEDQQCPA